MTYTRRNFIKSVVGLVALSYISFKDVAHKALAPSAEGKEYTHEWVMTIDQGKCVGCNYCTWACKAVNDTPPDVYWNLVFIERKTTDGTIFLPRPCMHCEEPPCVEVCPVGATYKRKEDGLVVMDYERCVGCRYCIAACPYGARYFNWRLYQEPNPYAPRWGEPEVPRRRRGVVEKCTFCVHRIDKGLKLGLKPGVDPEATPACVNICPTGARRFGDLNDVVGSPREGRIPRSVILAKGRLLMKELGTKPRVYYLPP